MSDDRSDEEKGADEGVKQAMDAVEGAAELAGGVAGAAGAENAGEGVEAAGGIAKGAGGLASGIGDALGDSEAGEGLRTAGQVLETAGGLVESGTGVARSLQSGNVAGAAQGLGQGSQYLLHGEEAEAAMRGAQAVGGLASAAQQIGGMIGGGSGHDDVRFHLEVASCDGAFGVRSVAIDEGLNRVGGASIVAVYNGHLEVEELLRKECALSIEREVQTRSYKGIVWSARVEEDRHEDVVVSLQVVPAAEFLSQIIDSRIYQELTAPQIIEQAYTDRLGGQQRSVRNDLQGSYEAREYTVQYQESVLAFISRLAEDEGIFWYFDHEDDKEVLVLADTPSNQAGVRGDGKVPFAESPESTPDHEAVVAASHVTEVGTTDAVVSDYDWTNPPLQVRAEQTGRGDDPPLEMYDHTDALQLHSYSGTQYGGNTATPQAQLRAERLDLARQHWQLVATVVTAQAGRVIEIEGCPDAELDQRYLIVGVSGRGRASEGQQGGWETTLEVVPVSMPYRPARRTAHPSIAGFESATVVGPSGEEIYTDEHGRIKVQFHWDRQGQRDEHSSCWLRVMQSWAGPGFGVKLLPRIGMEVMVAFMGGNPDRPIAVGCVYNGQNPSPVANPDDKTQSVIRTKSSPNSDGFNELRFEDKAGSEFIFTHAQKDYNEVVEHCHSTHVKVDQSNTVDHDHTETVGNDQKLTVKRDRTKAVDGNETSLIGGGDAPGNRTETVWGDEEVTINQKRTHTVVKDETLTVTEGKRTVHVQTGKDLETYDGGRTVTVKAFDNLKVVDGANRNVHVAGQFNITVDGAHYSLKQGGTEKLVQASGQTYVESASQVHVKVGPSHLVVKSDGSITLKTSSTIGMEVGSSKLELTPSSIALESNEIQLKAGESALKLEASKATLKGAMVDLLADMFATIKGTLVRIN